MTAEFDLVSLAGGPGVAVAAIGVAWKLVLMALKTYREIRREEMAERKEEMAAQRMERAEERADRREGTKELARLAGSVERLCEVNEAQLGRLEEMVAEIRANSSDLPKRSAR